MSTRIPAAMILALTLAACRAPSSEVKFDRATWREARSPDYTNRAAMFENLIKRVKLQGKAQAEIFELLGPNEISSLSGSQIGYVLSENFSGVDPVGGKNLIIEFAADGKVRSWLIREWSREHA